MAAEQHAGTERDQQLLVTVKGNGIGVLYPRKQSLIAGREEGRATPGRVHVEVDLLAPGDGGQFRQRVDGAKIRAASHADQRQHLELLLPALLKGLFQCRQTEPIVLVCVETPDAASPESQQIHPLVEGVVHQPRAQNDGAAIALPGEGEQVVATGPVASQPEGGDVGDGTATGHDAEGCILGMHMGCIEGVVLAVDQTVQLGQHFPLQKAQQTGGLHLHRVLVEHHQEPGELGGEGRQRCRHVSHVAGRGEVRCPGYQGGEPCQIVPGRDADGGHARLIELVGEAAPLIGGLTVVGMMEMLQQGRHGLAEIRIRLCKQFSELHRVLQTRLSGRRGHPHGRRRRQSIHQRGGGHSHLWPSLSSRLYFQLTLVA